MNHFKVNAFSLIHHLSILKDYRQSWKTQHKLTDILLMMTCAVIGGSASWEDIEDFGKILAGSYESVYETEEKNPGRDEHRIHVVSDLFDEFVNLSFDRKGMRTMGAVIAFRQEGRTPQNIENVSVRYYISFAELSANKLATSTREHWGIENSLHYVLDVAMSGV